MKGGLEARILKLEQSAKAVSVCNVARFCPDGRLAPSIPGTTLAPYFAELPEVCAPTGDWLAVYVSE